MRSIIHLNTTWEHTLNEILNHKNITEVGIIMRAWVKQNKLEDMSDLLVYDLNDSHQQVLFASTKKQLMQKRPKLYQIHL